MPEARFFANPAEFRAWLKKNHRGAAEVLVGFFTTKARQRGRRSMTWPESVAEALCYGWIDGVRKRLDDDRYTIRFTPRRPRSKWSAVNVRMVGELEAAGRMTDAGRAVFAARPDPESKGYKASKKDGTLDAARVREFKKHKEAWAYFEAQPPGYRKAAAWWVMNAKQEETRARRLARLVEYSERGKRLT